MKKPSASQSVAEPLVPELVRADLVPVTEASSTVMGFMASIVGFFTQASLLEQRAKGSLEMMQEIAIPTTMQDDEALQKAVRQTTADIKEVESFFDPATGAFHGIHKKLVSVRRRSLDPLQAANARGNSLHQTYVANERARAAREQEAKRLEAEQQARETRQRELAELDAQAFAAEQASPKLSVRELVFVATLVQLLMDTDGGVQALRLLRDLEAHLVNTPGPRAELLMIEAAKRAEYQSPETRGPQLYATTKIRAAIEAKFSALALQAQRQAIAEAPLDPVEVETVTPNISRGDGYDRTTYSAELLDEKALIAAILSGEHGIPVELLQINQTALNSYARQLRETINRWPGVRLKKSTKVI